MTTQFFDPNGRRVVPDGLAANVTEPDMDYRLANYNSFRLFSRVARLRAALSGFDFMPDRDFAAQIAALTARIDADEALSGVFNGPCFPVSLPQVRFEDQGVFLNQTLLPALGTIYQAKFEGRDWTNYREKDEPGLVTIVDESYQLLLNALSSEPRAAIMSLPLQGYSVLAQREQMKSLPQTTSCNISLGGPVDLILTTATHIEEFMRDGNTPGYDCAAAQWRSADRSLYLEARDDGADFDYRGSLGCASDRCSGGLLFW